MIDKDKITLLLFITRTSMFIPCVDEKNVISFIHGFEIGSKDSCDFTKLLKTHFAENLAIPSSSDGWSGQIKRFANKKLMDWTTAFKQVGLEVLASEQNGGLDIEMQGIIKSRILALIEKISESGDPYFDKSWIEEWESLCSTKKVWFKKLWTDNEFKIIKSIAQEINNNRVFEDWKPFRPTEKLLELRNKFDTNQKNNGS